MACLQVTSCSSFNLATFPDINGKLLCELLPSDKHRMPNELIHNPMFDHFSKTRLEQENYFEKTLLRVIGSHIIDFISYDFLAKLHKRWVCETVLIIVD